MSSVENLLSKILVVPDFLAAHECAALLRDFDSRPVHDLAVGQQNLHPLEVAFGFADLENPARLIAQIHRSQVSAVVMLKYMGRDALRQVGAVTSLGDVNEENGARALEALQSAVKDHRFFIDLGGLLELPKDSASQRELEVLLDEGILRRDGSTYALADPIDEPQKLALAWFHIRLLEEAVFTEGLRKSNRLVSDEFVAAVRAGKVAHGPLRRFFERCAPAHVGLLDSRRVSNTLFALHELFSSQERRGEFLLEYMPETLGRRAEHNDFPVAIRDMRDAVYDGTQGGKRSPWRLVQLVLHLLAPDLFIRPAERAVAKGIRNTQSFGIDHVRATLNSYMARLKTECVEPYYGINVVPDYSDIGVLKYVPGGYYLPHVDACRLKDVAGEKVWIKTLPRDVSVLIYLSDRSAFTGGQLTFPSLHLSISPQQGMAVTFPSDNRFPHHAEEVLSGTRYAIVAWLKCREGGPVGQPCEFNW